MADLYYAGRYEAALNLCLSLADAPNVPPWIFSTVGTMFLRGLGTEENREEGLRWYRRAAEAGDGDALTYLAAHERDAGRYLEAAALLEKASLQGHPRALIHLGYLYDRGLGVPRDPKRARQCYEQAAQQGYPYAKGLIAAKLARGEDGWLGIARGIVLLPVAAIQLLRIRRKDPTSPRARM